MVSDPEQSVEPSYRWVDSWVAVGVSVAALGLYIATLAPTVLEADGGEFQFVPWLPGIAHPTGYPLYVLLGWLWTHLLPLGEVAWRMNLLSAVLAAGAVGVTYGLARRVLDLAQPETPALGRVLAAVISAATFAVTPTFWSQAIIAEVYALHALFLSLIVYLVLGCKNNPPGCNLAGKWLALTVGLSLTHHRTIILLFPALLIFLWFTQRNSSAQIVNDNPTKTSSLLFIVHCSLLIVFPLLLYLYLPIIAPLTPYSTIRLSEAQTLTLYDNSFAGFWRHGLGSVFTGELKPAAAGLDRLWLTWRLLQQQVGWVGIGLAVAGLGVVWRRRQIDLLWLTGLGFMAFVAFNLIYFIGDVFVLFIPAWLFVSIWIGLGLLGLAGALAQAFVRGKTGSLRTNPTFGPLEQRLSRRIAAFMTISLVILGGLLPMTLLIANYSRVDQRANVVARDRWLTILSEPIPEGAILLSNDRNELMPLWYYQYVEGRRPDLVGLFPLIVPEPAFANVGRVLDQALAAKRPVYFIKAMAGLNLKAAISPAGTIFKVTPLQTAPVNPVQASLPAITLTTPQGVITESIQLVGYDLSSAQLKPGLPVSITLHWQPTQPLSVAYTSYVHLINSAGIGITQSDHRPGGDFYPTLLWQVGEILRDQHQLAIPANLAADTYRLRVGMYYQPQPGVIVGMGDGLELGSITVP